MPVITKQSVMIPAVLAAVAMVVLGAGGALVWRAKSKVNKLALSDAPRPVTVIAANGTTFRDTRTYVGQLRPWIEANVGPQYISVYVDTVLVRPGAVVKRGEVLATLDCRNASAQSQAVAAQARAIDAEQRAFADQADRMQGLLNGGFIDPNTVQINQAQSASDKAKLEAERAKLMAQTLEVNDCVLRAPFDGEIATRTIDPGAFVRPGTAIVSVVDRRTIRMTFDAPENDFDLVGVGTPVSIRVVATGKTVTASVSRRSPSVVPDTRTVHVECDIQDRDREIPVNSSAEVRIEVGQPIGATAVPLYTASITGETATVFVVDNGIARHETFRVLGEVGKNLYVETTLRPGTPVVAEGQFALSDGDRVATKEAAYASTSALAPSASQSQGPSSSPRGVTP
jgi:membrane fusion protein (multidrug efflux system)